MKRVFCIFLLVFFTMAGTGYSGEAVVWLASDKSMVAWPSCVTQVRNIPGTPVFRVWFGPGDMCLTALAQVEGVIFVEESKTIVIPQGQAVQDSFSMGCNTLENVDRLLELGTGEDTIVAVVDTGISFSVFGQAVAINEKEIPDDGIDNDNNGYVDDYLGWDFGEMDVYPADLQGHGTQVSSMLLSVAPDTRILPIKVSVGNNTSFSTGAAAEAIYYAASRGVDVINMSFSTADFSYAIFTAVTHALDAGILVVAATGNDGRALQFPASMDGVVAVGSHDAAGSPSWFSPVGDTMGLLGPGENVCVTDRDGTIVRVSGTSFSAPVAAGAGAVLKSMNPHLTPLSLRRILYKGTVDILDPGYDIYSGYGNISAERIFSAATPRVRVPDRVARGSLPAVAIDLPPTDVVTDVYFALMFNDTILWMDAAGSWSDAADFYFAPFHTHLMTDFTTLKVYGDDGLYGVVDTAPHPPENYLWVTAIFDNNGIILGPVSWAAMRLHN